MSGVWPPTAATFDGMPDDVEWVPVGDGGWISRPATTPDGTLRSWWAHRSPKLERNDLGQVVYRPGGHVLVSEEPLTIEGSLLCLPADMCGLHGWVRDGKWVPA